MGLITHGFCKEVPVTPGGKTEQNVLSINWQQQLKAFFWSPATTALLERHPRILDW